MDKTHIYFKSNLLLFIRILLFIYNFIIQYDHIPPPISLLSHWSSHWSYSIKELFAVQFCSSIVGNSHNDFTWNHRDFLCKWNHYRYVSICIFHSEFLTGSPLDAIGKILPYNDILIEETLSNRSARPSIMSYSFMEHIQIEKYSFGNQIRKALFCFTKTPPQQCGITTNLSKSRDFTLAPFKFSFLFGYTTWLSPNITLLQVKLDTLTFSHEDQLFKGINLQENLPNISISSWN